MASTWFRKRLLLTLLVSVLMAVIVSQLFVYPYIEQKATNYNSQSLYRNTSIDFVAPEPSFEQVSELPGTNGIDTVFPFYLTKALVDVNGKARTTTILVTDRRQSLEGSMYDLERTLERSEEAFDDPVLVDWQFCHDTGADIGDAISIKIGESAREYRVSAIYETNALYDGGALLLQASDELLRSIRETAQNNGYSGMYITASDYDACRTYLTTDYRPLGRLRTRDQFADDAQYQIHYDAIMSSGYANEITDLRVRESELERPASPLLPWLGALIAAALIVAFNVMMANRGCEKNYFSQHCIPNGQDVRPYYLLSFAAETICCVSAYALALSVRINAAPIYIHSSALDLDLILFPAAVIASELICLTVINRTIYAAKGSAVEMPSSDGDKITVPILPKPSAQDVQPEMPQSKAVPEKPTVEASAPTERAAEPVDASAASEAKPTPQNAETAAAEDGAQTETAAEHPDASAAPEAKPTPKEAETAEAEGEDHPKAAAEHTDASAAPEAKPTPKGAGTAEAESEDHPKAAAEHTDASAVVEPIAPPEGAAEHVDASAVPETKEDPHI